MKAFSCPGPLGSSVLSKSCWNLMPFSSPFSYSCWNDPLSLDPSSLAEKTLPFKPEGNKPFSGSVVSLVLLALSTLAKKNTSSSC